MRLKKVGIGALVGASTMLCVLGPAACTNSGTSARAKTDRPKRPANEDRSDTPSVTIPSSPAVPWAETRERALGLLIVAAKTGTPEERSNAIEALVSTPARLAGVVEAALLDSNEGLRTVAAMAVGKAKLTSATGAVAPLLNDSSPWVRAAALYALKRCGQNVNITPLAELLMNPSPRLRAHAAFILGELGERSAEPMLREIAKDNLNRAKPAETRMLDLQIAEARLKLGDDVALADVRAALFPAKPEDLEAAVLACQIIGQIKDQPSANSLIQLTGQKDASGQYQPPEVRLAAAGALAQLNHEPRKARFVAFEYFAGEKDTLRAQAAFVLGLSKDPAVLGTLARMLDDPVGRVRIAAAAAIVRMTDQG